MREKISIKCISGVFITIVVLYLGFILIGTKDKPLSVEEFIVSYYDAMINRKVDEAVSKIYLYDKKSDMYALDSQAIKESEFASYEINSIEEIDNSLYAFKYTLKFNEERANEIETFILNAETEEEQEKILETVKSLTEGYNFVLIENNKMYIVRNYNQLPENYKELILSNDTFNHLIYKPEISSNDIVN